MSTPTLGSPRSKLSFFFLFKVLMKPSKIKSIFSMWIYQTCRAFFECDETLTKNLAEDDRRLCNISMRSACGPQRSGIRIFRLRLYFVNVVSECEPNLYMNFTLGSFLKNSQLQMRYLKMCKYLNNRFVIFFSCYLN